MSEGENTYCNFVHAPRDGILELTQFLQLVLKRNHSFSDDVDYTLSFQSIKERQYVRMTYGLGTLETILCHINFVR